MGRSYQPSDLAEALLRQAQAARAVASTTPDDKTRYEAIASRYLIVATEYAHYFFEFQQVSHKLKQLEAELEMIEREMDTALPTKGTC